MGHPRLVKEGGWGEQVQQEWPSKSSCPSVEDVADNGWDLSGKWQGHGSSRRVLKKIGHFGPTWWLIPASKWNVNGLLTSDTGRVSRL